MEEVKYQLSCKCCKSKFTKTFPMFSGDTCPVCRSKNTVAKELNNIATAKKDFKKLCGICAKWHGGFFELFTKLKADGLDPHNYCEGNITAMFDINYGSICATVVSDKKTNKISVSNYVEIWDGLNWQFKDLSQV